MLNQDPHVLELAASFAASVGFKGFSQLSIEAMATSLLKLNECLDTCIKDCVMKESKSQSIHIDGQSHQIQIGHGNVQAIHNSFEILFSEIDRSDAAPKEKEEAKSLLRGVLKHPLVTAILGGIAGRQF